MKHIFLLTGPACLAASLTFLAPAVPAFSQEAAAAPADAGAALFMELIRLQTNHAKKLELMEQFAARYPQHEYTGRALDYMQNAYLASEQYDKVLQTGERILQKNSADTSAATLCLRAAEGKKDQQLIKSWTERVNAVQKRQASESKDSPQKVASPKESSPKSSKEMPSQQPKDARPSPAS